MSALPSDIQQFVSSVVPFNQLSPSLISQLAQRCHIEYLRKNHTIHKLPGVYLIRKGAISYFDNNGELLSRYGEGDMCSVFMFPEDRANIKVHVDEDSLLYFVEKVPLLEIVNQNEDTQQFFSQTAGQRLKKRLNQLTHSAVNNSQLITTLVKDFYHSPVASVTADTSIQQAALVMSDQKYSSLIVHLDDDSFGIVTDKDIRNRCVAKALPVDFPISDIMTTDVITIDANANAYDALVLMISSGIHHLPVTQDEQLTGMITVTDLMNHQGHNAINLVSLVRKASSVERLAEISQMLPKLQVQLAKLGTSADHVGKSISAVTMAITKRLIFLAEKTLGPAPVPYAWVSAGSQARQEQLCHSDQDNALIIDDAMTTDDEGWFQQLATFVCDGLNQCGFEYCPGDIMATNPKWRLRQKDWHRLFADWVTAPQPEALLNASVFFDIATVHGDAHLLTQVQQKMLQLTKGNSVFIAHMCRNALRNKPPLGFFRDFVLEDSGENGSGVNLKQNGITLIVDLARIYALEQGINAVNTVERLRLAEHTPAVSSQEAKNLRHAFEIINHLRMNHQAHQISQQREINNIVHPKFVSRLEREHLKDAFKVIKNMQNHRQVSF